MKCNKGFSLIELIIVIAILAVVTGVSFVGLGYLYNSNVKSTIKKINTSLLQTQSYTTAKSVGGRDIYFKLYQDSGDYYTAMCREDSSGNEIKLQEPEKVGKKNLTVKYVASDGINVNEVDINSSNSLKLYFDRSTGGLLPMANGGSTYCSKIEISVNGLSKCSVTISKITGKTEVAIFQ